MITKDQVIAVAAASALLAQRTGRAQFVNSAEKHALFEDLTNLNSHFLTMLCEHFHFSPTEIMEGADELIKGLKK